MEPEKAEIRIVSGSLRGRRLNCVVHPGLRPTPQRVRESLFSILGDAVPDRPFYDVFAGTGVNGFEALSRGASRAIFLERDGKLAASIDSHLEKFGMIPQGQILRGDVYRWAERWLPPADAVNVFLSPPFPDLQNRLPEFTQLVAAIQGKLPLGSVLSLQLETGFDPEGLPDASRWEVRQYGRNLLLFWEPLNSDAAPTAEPDEEG